MTYTTTTTRTVSPSWPGLLCMPRICIHPDGGRLGPFYWVNQWQATIHRHADGRLLGSETWEKPGSFRLQLKLFTNHNQ